MMPAPAAENTHGLWHIAPTFPAEVSHFPHPLCKETMSDCFNEPKRQSCQESAAFGCLIWMHATLA